MKIKGIQVKIDHLKEFKSAVKDLTKNACFVGYPEDTTDRKDKDNPGHVTNAGLGYIHEHGAPEANIPPRPHLNPGIADAKSEIVPILRATALKALDGDTQAVKRGLNSVGLKAQYSVQNRITTGPFIPLKPGTLAARRRRGHKGESPLIDTGQLRRAINYVIRGTP